MGSNMQRQSVPLLYPEAPLIGTGLEGQTARDSGMTVLSIGDGKVIKIDGGKIILKKFFYVDKKDNIETLKKKTQRLEYKAFSEAVIKVLK